VYAATVLPTDRDEVRDTNAELLRIGLILCGLIRFSFASALVYESSITYSYSLDLRLARPVLVLEQESLWTAGSMRHARH